MAKKYVHRFSACISIHALLAESDEPVCGIFYQCTIFLSTLSLRRATGWLTAQVLKILISIHALLAESDSKMPQKTVSFL